MDSFGSGHRGEHLYTVTHIQNYFEFGVSGSGWDVILNFCIFSWGGPFDQPSWTISEILEVGIIGDIRVKLFEICAKGLTDDAY